MILKRYDCITDGWGEEGYYGAMEEAPTGEYVRWDDMQALLAHLEKKYGIVIESAENASFRLTAEDNIFKVPK